MQKNVDHLNQKLVRQLMNFINLKIKIGLAASEIEVKDDELYVTEGDVSTLCS